MLTGSRLFVGETVSDTLAAVLTKEVDVSKLPAGIPPDVRTVIARCLERDPHKRLRDIGDARIEIGEALARKTASGIFAPADTVHAAQARRPAAWMLAAVLVLGILSGLAIGALLSKSTPASGPAAGVVNLDLNFPKDLVFEFFLVTTDGTKIVAIGRPRTAPGVTEAPSQVYVRAIAGGAMAPVPGTEGAEDLQLSNDSRWIHFTAPPSPGVSQLNLMRVPIDGSAPPFTLCAWDPKWDSFTSLENGDHLVISGGVDLVRIPKDGGTPVIITKIDTSNVRGTLLMWYRPPPGGRHVFVQSISYGSRGWFHQVGSLEVASGKIRWLVEDAGFPVYDPSGHLVFSRGDVLLAAPFDVKTMELTGTPVPILDGLRTRFSFQPAEFDLSNNGVLVFGRGGRMAEGRRLGTIDASGQVKPLSEERRVYQFLDAGAADGKRFVVTITNGQGIDEIWLGEIDHPGLRRIHSIQDADLLFPLLSPDGNRVAFVRRGKNDEDGIYVMEAETTSAPVKIATLPPDEQRFRLSGWEPDGTSIVAARDGADRKGDIVRVVLPRGEGELADIVPILATHADESLAVPSPDGRLLAWVSDETGRNEIYIASYAGGRVGRSVQVTRAGGIHLVWAPDGRSIRFGTPSRQAFDLTITPSPPYVSGEPSFVFDAEALRVFPANLLPDGREIAVIRGENEEDEVRSCAVVLNWTQQLEAKMRESASR